MNSRVTWKGKFYESLEHCSIKQSAKRTTIASTIVGVHKRNIYQLNYLVETNNKWETKLAEVEIVLNNTRQKITCKKEKGKYFINGKRSADFDSVTDIDITLTPFTNTLPIRRLLLKNGEKATINVAYFDVFEKTLKPATQHYSKISAREYLFQTGNKDFRATITIDSDGLVTNYPALFKMIAKQRYR